MRRIVSEDSARDNPIPRAPQVRPSGPSAGISVGFDAAEICRRIRLKNLPAQALQTAFTHSSFVNESPRSGLEDYERLEFIGDAVLGLAIAQILFDRYPNCREGDLTRMRASLVNRQVVGTVAKELGLGPFILLGKGEAESGGAEKLSILCEVFEALLAVIYIERGFGGALEVVQRHMSEHIDKAVRGRLAFDYKTQLQEIAQRVLKCQPLYEIQGESGPDHAREFVAIVKIDGEAVGEGRGPSKKEAQQEAARVALESMQAPPARGAAPKPAPVAASGAASEPGAEAPEPPAASGNGSAAPGT